MIYEYALEPQMVASWGEHSKYCLFIREFSSGQGRLVSRYPKRWARKVWDSFSGSNEIERKRLEELLVRLQGTMIKRKNIVWDENIAWLDNAVKEHARHPFSAVMARKNITIKPEIIYEDTLETFPCSGWDNPHSITVNRTAHDMAAAVKQMLLCCRWIKFIDPYIFPAKSHYKQSLRVFMNILAGERQVGPPVSLEIHASKQDDTADSLRQIYAEHIPVGLQVTLFQWQQRPNGQKLHNRYILTDLGGVSFHHGLDTGFEGETDDLTRLDDNQYQFRCGQYDASTQAFDQAADPIVITGTFKGQE